MIVLNGKTIYLSLIKPDLESAAKIIELRSGEAQKKFLSTSVSSIHEQLTWLENYSIRNEKNEEFYFFIKRLDTKEVIGTIRAYDFNIDINSFCWGSWILNDHKTVTAAIESHLLINKFSFYDLKFDRSHFDVRKENEKVISFHRKTGAKIVREDEFNYYFCYSIDEFNVFLDKYKELIK